jgi:SAM-dependent methyltransferase
MGVSYDFAPNFPGWTMAQGYFTSLISEHGCKRILEVGAGANPTLPPEFVQASGLSYLISDSSADELKKTSFDFEHIILDLSAETIEPALTESFDCVLSRMVEEHVNDGHQYHRNIYRVLRPWRYLGPLFLNLVGPPVRREPALTRQLDRDPAADVFTEGRASSR